MQSKEVYLVKYKRGNRYEAMRSFDNKADAEQFRFDNSYRNPMGKYVVQKTFEVTLSNKGALCQ